jgi:FkbM family methyltransferase
VSEKPKEPWPRFLRAALKRILPEEIYKTYIGRHERESLRWWIRLAAGVDPTKAILDIGAYHGQFARAARDVNANAPIFAFEPNPEAILECRQNCEGANILVEQLALSDSDTLVCFQKNKQSSHIVAHGSKLVDNEMIQIPARCLDHWIEEKGVIPDLINIDTEGAEASILRGGKRSIGEYEPVILCEILSDDAGQAVMDILPSGYLYYFIDENKGIELRNTITRKTWRNYNWLLVPANRCHLLD